MLFEALIETICKPLTQSGGRLLHAEHGDIAAAKDTQRIARFVYLYHYLGNASPKDTGVTAPSSIPEKVDEEFTSRYREVIRDPYFTDSGWHLIKDAPTTKLVEKNGIFLEVHANEILAKKTLACGGEQVVLKMPVWRAHASPGYFSACTLPGPVPVTVPIDRLYINAGTNTAPDIWSAMLNWAALRKIPGTIKAANNPGSFDRPDTIVAYFPRAAFQDNRSELLPVIQTFSDGIRYQSPMFTEKIAPGISWAEDPISDGLGAMSFGMHRCMIVASALAEAQEHHFSEGLAELVIRRWLACGLSCTEPHLSPKK